jgi:hypothetical protein
MPGKGDDRVTSCLQAEYQKTSHEPGGSTVASPVVESALKNISEYRARRADLFEQLTSAPGTPIECLASYWMGVLEGTVASLLEVIQASEETSSQ